MKRDLADGAQIMATDHDSYQTDDARWRAVVTRDPDSEGAFFYSVSTTGVYCRPTCGSRRPLREHTRFHDTWRRAESAGYRACKRCKPNDISESESHARAVEAACRRIESAEETPTLTELAEGAGYSSYHFHRLFKRHTGVTPKAYAQAHRSKKIKFRLRKRDAVTDAIYEAGYGAGSRFYEESNARLGMTPTQFKQGGAGRKIRYTIAGSSLGLLLIAATAKGICLIHFGENRRNGSDKYLLR